MDNASQLIFVTDIKAQMATLHRIAQRLEDRATGLTATDTVPWVLRSKESKLFVTVVKEPRDLGRAS